MATVKIAIDNQQYEVEEGQNLLHVALSLGLDLPYFCWHPALGSVGACRQCAVMQFKDKEDEQGKIVMACMTPAEDGTRIALHHPEAADFREHVIEWLMVNHPHDCPVCDEGGECHLQDMTVMTGHTYRRYRFPKRTYRNQYLGPLVNHEMNRCIQCYRCVRFYRDYADGDDLDVFGAHDHVYFGRHEDGVLESPFSGNLVEVCPTGVFTDKTLKQHYTRKWDLQTAPSVCTLCSVGCNTIPGERYGKLRRIRNRYNRAVNGYFLCDRGRYGYEFVNNEQRLHQALRRLDGIGVQCVITPEEALMRAVLLTAEYEKVIGIGSPRAALEANYALQQLVGKEGFFSGASTHESQLVDTAVEILRNGPARSPSLHEIEQADAILILGEDVTNTAPRLALALRQAARNVPRQTAAQLNIHDWDDAAVREVVQQNHGPLFIATTAATALDNLASATYYAAPDDIARLGFAIAHVLDENAPAVVGLAEETQTLANQIAESLRGAERPLIVSGVSAGREALLRAAAQVAWSLRAGEQPAALSLILPECNSFGLSLLGGRPLHEALEQVVAGEVTTVIVLENDLYQRAKPAFVEALLADVNLIVIDSLMTPTSARANVVLPAATFAEGDGMLVNNEGRAQRFYQVFEPAGDIQESWRWLGQMYQLEPWETVDQLTALLAQTDVIWRPLTEIAPPADFRIHGERIPRQSHRYNGRTAMHANQGGHEPQPPADPDAPLAYSMEGFKGQPPAPLISRYWALGWNSVQALNKFQEEVGGLLHGEDDAQGQRLIEPATSAVWAYWGRMPEAFQPQDDYWLFVPFYHIFGSEWRSKKSGGLAELGPEPYVSLNSDAAASLGVQAGDQVEVAIAEQVAIVPVRIDPSLPAGVAGLPRGVGELVLSAWPAWGEISRA